MFKSQHHLMDYIDLTLSDIAVQNIMMDARPLYPEGYHPVRQNYTPDGMYTISPLSRTDRPVRYYYIDFGLSVQFAPGAAPYVVGDVGRDTDVPELSDSVPYDAFKVDIFALGNLFYKEFYQVSPRPVIFQFPPHLLCSPFPFLSLPESRAISATVLTTLAEIHRTGLDF